MTEAKLWASRTTTDHDRNLYWGAERAIWKNAGDVLTVCDDENRRVIRESY